MSIPGFTAGASLSSSRLQYGGRSAGRPGRVTVELALVPFNEGVTHMPGGGVIIRHGPIMCIGSAAAATGGALSMQCVDTSIQ